MSNPLPEIPDLEIPDIVPVSNPLPDIPDIIAESEAALASEPEPAEPEAASRPMELVVETSSNAKKGKGSKRGGKVKRRRYATDVGIGPKLKLLQEEYGLKVDD